MANKNISNVAKVSTLLRTDSVFVEIGGAVRRIKIEDLMNSINQGNEQLLRQVAWGIPLQPSGITSTNWGRIGNVVMYDEYKRNCGRYLVTNNGKAAKLSPTDSSVYADGTPLDESKGHIMTIRPRLYYFVKEDPVSGNTYVWFSQLPIGGHFIEQDVSGAYIGSMAGGALTSRSGLAPAGLKDINQFWAAAQVNGKDWGLCSYDIYQKKLVALGLSEYGDTNIQARLGYGVCGSEKKTLWAEAAKLKTGATKSLGDGFGKIPIEVTNGANVGVDCSRVSLLGTEDPYGWLYTTLQGIYFGSSGNSAQKGTEVFIYEGNRIPTSSEFSNHPSGKYRELTRLITGGYISKMNIGEFFDLIPSAIGGGSSSYWSSYNSASDSTRQIPMFGGYADSNPYNGLCSLHSAKIEESRQMHIGTRLAYYGPIVFVDGREIV